MFTTSHVTDSASHYEVNVSHAARRKTSGWEQRTGYAAGGVRPDCEHQAARRKAFRQLRGTERRC